MPRPTLIAAFFSIALTAPLGLERASTSAAQRASAAVSVASDPDSPNTIATRDFSISLPDRLIVADLTSRAPDTREREFRKIEDGLGKDLADAARISAKNEMIKTLAFDPKTSSATFVNNMNIVVTNTPAEIPSSQRESFRRAAIRGMISGLKSQGFECRNEGTVSFNGHEFVQLDFHSDDTNTDIRMYAIMVSDRMLAFTFACSSQTAEEFLAESVSMMKTVRIHGEI